MSDEIAMWRGRPVADMTREELLEVVIQLGRIIHERQESHTQTLNVWRMFREARRT